MQSANGWWMHSVPGAGDRAISLEKAPTNLLTVVSEISSEFDQTIPSRNLFGFGLIPSSIRVSKGLSRQRGLDLNQPRARGSGHAACMQLDCRSHAGTRAGSPLRWSGAAQWVGPRNSAAFEARSMGAGTASGTRAARLGDGGPMAPHGALAGGAPRRRSLGCRSEGGGRCGGGVRCGEWAVAPAAGSVGHLRMYKGIGG